MAVDTVKKFEKLVDEGKSLTKKLEENQKALDEFKQETLNELLKYLQANRGMEFINTITDEKLKTNLKLVYKLK